MSDQKQHLSAFLDNDLDSDEQRALQLDDAGHTLHRYQLIGEAMRGQISELSLMDVSRKVSESIAHEHIDAVDTAGGDTISRPSPAGGRKGWLSGLFDFGDWLRPVGGLAVAASVAMIVVVSLQQEGDPQVARHNVVAPQTLASQEAASALRAGVAAVPGPANIVPVSTAGQADLDRYLQQHSEYAARDTAQGRMPYVRAVGYKSKQ